MDSPRRGEIHWVDWTPHRGSEQAGRRPGLVISGDKFNELFHVCTVLAVTTQVKPSRIAVTLPQDVTGRLCQILPWQVMTIAESRLDGYLAALSREQLTDVNKALAQVWTLRADT